MLFDGQPYHNSTAGVWTRRRRPFTQPIAPPEAHFEWLWVFGMMLLFILLLILVALMRPRPARRPIIVIAFH
jgi:hypothetical protein